ncbi:hypothetical protein RQM47_16250 [Rubrivirga sp. S365]|uniref:hypothetical protein n=1 Tax=Rubrivirga sp. S365 TaxID=3076080 RepID=UPI0028C55493|nr:hypothetical protein [Rubrivirga sp. S365]MDT7858201.1 hypothetical protein [Rubrivirga sp. S365]
MKLPRRSPEGPPYTLTLRDALLASVGAVLATVAFAGGCNRGDAVPRAEPVVRLAACVEAAPSEPCARVPGVGPAYWLAEQGDRTATYLDAAEICLGALLDGAVVGRRGACVDVYDAYVADAKDGRRDLDGRLDAADAGRAFGLAYSAVVARRTQAAGQATTGRDYNAAPLFGGDSPDPR